MWTTLALVTALSLTLAQDESVKVTNFRPTYGFMGPKRPDAKFLPGDFFFVAFELENLKTDDTGKARYKIALEMKEKAGKRVLYSYDPDTYLDVMLPLGGGKMPAFAYVEVPSDGKAGEYSLKVTVTDGRTKKADTLTQDFEILEKGFGLIRPGLIYDFQSGPPAPPIGIAGQVYWIRFFAVGFKRSESTKQPSVTLEMQVLDKEGKKVLAKPVVGDFPDKNKPAAPEVQVVPMQFQLHLNRGGEFTIKLKATDNVAKKEATLSFDINVMEVK